MLRRKGKRAAQAQLRGKANTARRRNGAGAQCEGSDCPHRPPQHPPSEAMSGASSLARCSCCLGPSCLLKGLRWACRNRASFSSYSIPPAERDGADGLPAPGPAALLPPSELRGFRGRRQSTRQQAPLAAPPETSSAPHAGRWWQQPLRTAARSDRAAGMSRAGTDLNKGARPVGARAPLARHRTHPQPSLRRRKGLAASMRHHLPGLSSLLRTPTRSAPFLPEQPKSTAPEPARQ